MRWIIVLLLALTTGAPAAAEIDVPDYEKQIAKGEQEARELDRQDPAAAATARQELEQLRRDAAAALAGFGERALDEEYDLALAEDLLERGQDIAQLDELAQLATHIVDIREDVKSRHANASHDYERLAANAGTAGHEDAWFELLEEYGYLVRWSEVDRTIKKIHDSIGKELFPLLVTRADADMAAGDHGQAMERYQAAAAIRPGMKDLQDKLLASTDFHRADELAAEALALLDADRHDYASAIELFDEGLKLHSDYPPLLDGRHLANRRGIEVLLEDASRAHANGRDLDALQRVDRARSLSTSHEPTRASLAEAEGVYREAVAERLVARGDKTAGHGYRAQAYVDYALAAAISDHVDVSQRMDDALSNTSNLIHYEVAIAAPSLGEISGWGDLAAEFSTALNQRIDDAQDGAQYHASVGFGEANGAGAVVTSEYRSFNVALDFQTITQAGAEVTRCKAQLDASLAIRIQQESSDLSWSQLLSYSNSYEGYCAAEPAEGEDATVEEPGHADAIPDDDACIHEMLGGLADQAHDAILGHIHTHGDRWKAHFEQQHPNWQTAHGAEDLTLLLLSAPAHSEEAADWAAQELLRRSGLRWADRSADIQAIGPLFD